MSFPEPTAPPATFRCPQCRAVVQPADNTCPACGVNLAWAAAIAERQVLAAAPGTSGALTETTDVILPRFGEFLVQSGDLTHEQLQAALTRQTELAAQGHSLTIGQVLAGMGLLTRRQLELASIQQVKQLQAALQESNRQLEERVALRTQELQEALQKLTEMSELKANFVANISHELRTPLVPIKLYNELMTDGSLGPLTDEQAEALKVTQRATLRLEALVDNLIQFASSLKGELRLNPAAHSPTQLGDQAVRASLPKAEKANVRLHTYYALALPPVLADGEKIRWVLFQLLDNAIKFTRAGGEVILSIEPHAQQLRLSVRDTGIGIPADKLPELFQPFHQLDGSITRQFGGTGLGLALVKRIVEAHQSRVQIESEPGRGTTFWFDLPIAGA
jgi:signal transduction histidine kinase